MIPAGVFHIIHMASSISISKFKIISKQLLWFGWVCKKNYVKNEFAVIILRVSIFVH